MSACHRFRPLYWADSTPASDLSKHQVDWRVDFSPHGSTELLSGRSLEIAEEALER